MLRLIRLTLAAVLTQMTLAAHAEEIRFAERITHRDGFSVMPPEGFEVDLLRDSILLTGRGANGAELKITFDWPCMRCASIWIGLLPQCSELGNVDLYRQRDRFVRDGLGWRIETGSSPYRITGEQQAGADKPESELFWAVVGTFQFPLRPGICDEEAPPAEPTPPPTESSATFSGTATHPRSGLTVGVPEGFVHRLEGESIVLTETHAVRAPLTIRIERGYPDVDDDAEERRRQTPEGLYVGYVILEDGSGATGSGGPVWHLVAGFNVEGVGLSAFADQQAEDGPPSFSAVWDVIDTVAPTPEK